MADDLVVEGIEVHARAQEVLGFWFELLMPEQWFSKSASVDGAIRDRFGDLPDLVLATNAAGWRDDPRCLLAAVIVLDQFPRNLFRGSPAAFAADPLARALTAQALHLGWDAGLSASERQFLYMPLMHAEDPAIQVLSLRCFAELGQTDSLAFARDHAEVIFRYGRFPSRNAALGRESSPEEREYLSRPGAGW